jgi:hypothetical protein
MIGIASDFEKFVGLYSSAAVSSMYPMALKCLMVRAEAWSVCSWKDLRLLSLTQKPSVYLQHCCQLSNSLRASVVLQHCSEQAEIDSEGNSHVCGRLFWSILLFYRYKAGLTWAQLCLIMVSRGVSSARTSRRASASNSSRPTFSEGEKVFPSDWIDSMVLETAAPSFGDTATSTDG